MEQITSGETPEQPEYYFDAYSSQLLLGKIAIDAHIEAGGHSARLYNLRDMNDVAELLLDKTIELPQAFERPDTTDWTRDDYLEYGRKLNSQTVPGQAQGSTSRLYDRASKLGLGPSGATIRKPRLFGKISTFQEELGLEGIRRRSAFDSWEFGDFIEHLRSVGEEEGVRPSIPILDRRIKDGKIEPHHKVIKKRVGNLYQAYELAGFIYPRNWDNERYLEWGADFLEANSRVPTATDLRMLSRLQRGPDNTGIYARFGSLVDFQDGLQTVQDQRLAQREKRRGQRLNSIQKEINTRQLPRDLFSDVEDEDEILRRAARYKITDSLLISFRKTQKISLSYYPFVGKKFAYHLQRYDEGISVWSIEDMARQFDYTDVIFPREAYISSLDVGAIHEAIEQIQNTPILSSIHP